MSSADESFYRCYKALHHVTHEAIPCVEYSLKTWHTNQQQTLSPCTAQCPAGKKPKQQMSCSNCIDWASEIESVYYQPTYGKKPQPQKTQKQITWQNVHSSGFGRTYVEVAKAFVLRLPKVPAAATQSTQQIQQQATGSTQAVSSSSTTVAISSSAAASATSLSTALGTSGSAATSAVISASSIPSSTPSVTKRYTKISDFDSASLLMIMAHFSEFHKGDQKAYELIEKISSIRNNLSHMALDCNMQVEVKTVTEIFTTLEDFVNWLAKIYPHHLRSQDVIARLNEIQSEPVTDMMKRDLLQSLCEEFKLMKDELQELSKTQHQVQEAVLDVTRNLEKLLQKSKGFEDAKEKITKVIEYLTDERKILSVIEKKIEHLSSASAQNAIKIEEVDKTTKHLVETTKQKLKVVQETAEKIADVDIAAKHLESRVEKVSCETKDIKQQLKIVQDEMADSKSDEIPFDVEHCRKQLMEDYRESRGKLPLFPGMPEEFADIDQLYVNLELVKTGKVEGNVLQSYEELFTLKDKDKKLLKRVLIRGGPGGGKTTIVSKIAYDWCRSYEQKASCLSEYKLLFALDLRDVSPGMSVIDAVQDQCLPFVSSQGLFDYISANASSVIFLLDGYDEASWIGSKSDKSTLKPDQFLKLLQNKWLQDSHVIVTTRPHRVSTYVEKFGVYTLVQLREMSESQITEYVAKFFNVPLEYLDDEELEEEDLNWFSKNICPAFAEAYSMLSACVRDKPKERCIAHIPILLTMLCVLWKEEKSLPCKITDVFDAALFYLAKHNWVKNQTSDELLEESLDRDLQETLQSIGEIALNNLLKDDLEGKLAFNDSEFHSQPDLLDKAVMLGIVTKERGRSKAKRFRTQHHISFLHKTFQEFCAAKYLATLEQLDRKQFEMCLSKINPSNVSDLNPMVQFCCGLSTEAATYILPYIVQVLKLTRFDNLIGDVTLDCSIGATGNPWTPALLLLHESQSPSLHSNLQPLFEIPSISLTLGNKRELLAALDYFLDCSIGASTQADKHLDAISVVNVNIEELSDKPVGLQVCGKFLKCTTNLQTLTVALPTDSLINPSFDSMAESLCDLQSFKQLILQGRFLAKRYSNNLHALIESLSKKRKSCKSLTDLKITFERLSGLIIKQFLFGLDNLKSLHLHNESGMYFDANRKDQPESARHSNSKILQSLKHLTLCGTGDFTALIVNLSAHENTCRNLRSLTISSTVSDISPMRRFLSQLVNLRNVSLRRETSTKLEDQENVAASQLLNCLVSKKLRSICIAHYHVPGKSLRPLLPKLLTLHCEYLDGNASEELLSVLYETSRKRFSEFSSGRSQSPLQCKQLRLHHLSVKSVRLLAKAFRYMPRLAVLNLSNSGISEANFKIIAIALPTLKSLNELNFSNNSVKEASALVAKGIAQLPRLEKLLLRSFFNDEGMRELSSSLHHLPKLKLLKLNYNPASSAMPLISSALQKFKCIEELNLRNTGLSDEGLICLPFQHMPNLVLLDIGGESYAEKLRIEKTFFVDVDYDSAFFGNHSNNQIYTPEGLRAVFTNLYHLQKLTCLKIMYDESWIKENDFWQRCYKQCLSDCEDFVETLVLERKQIESVSDFVRNGSAQ
ncbi:uncharacterized protein [Amphiura filiformis]|uniref:uncharacterized protein n=1 Tax=Amphiura filiformis TaxID=82378 RepID=UPI003B2138FC